MRIVAYIIAAMIAFLSLPFIIGFQGQISRLLIGLILLVAAGALVYFIRIQPSETKSTVVQKIDLSGDVSLEEFRCQSCDAPLNKEDIDVKAGAIMVECGHCGATYQIEEEPKW